MGHYRVFLSILTLTMFVLVFSSCKDDEEPVKPKMSFATTAMTVNEADGIVEIEVVLDKPAPEDFKLEFSLGGTADEEVAIGEDEAPDYKLNGDDYLELEFEKGATSGIIELQLYSDAFIEEDEVIEINLESVDSDRIELTRDDEIKITVVQEDGMLIYLTWPAPTATAQADMDIILRYGPSTSSWTGYAGASIEESFQSPEAVFVPNGLGEYTYGVSYIYYDGTLDPLTFTVRFIDLVNKTFEAEATQQTFTGTYTAVNKNKWTNPNTTVVVQTFQRSGTSWTNFSSITTPATGSRVQSTELPWTFKNERSTVRKSFDFLKK
jgi:hypothetical protein